jgi:hypothetical protein
VSAFKLGKDPVQTVVFHDFLHAAHEFSGIAGDISEILFNQGGPLASNSTRQDGFSGFLAMMARAGGRNLWPAAGITSIKPPPAFGACSVQRPEIPALRRCRQNFSPPALNVCCIYEIRILPQNRLLPAVYLKATYADLKRRKSSDPFAD